MSNLSFNFGFDIFSTEQCMHNSAQYLLVLYWTTFIAVRLIILLQVAANKRCVKRKIVSWIYQAPNLQSEWWSV